MQNVVQFTDLLTEQPADPVGKCACARVANVCLCPARGLAIGGDTCHHLSAYASHRPDEQMPANVKIESHCFVTAEYLMKWLEAEQQRKPLVVSAAAAAAPAEKTS